MFGGVHRRHNAVIAAAVRKLLCMDGQIIIHGYQQYDLLLNGGFKAAAVYKTDYAVPASTASSVKCCVPPTPTISSVLGTCTYSPSESSIFTELPPSTNAVNHSLSSGLTGANMSSDPWVQRCPPRRRRVRRCLTADGQSRAECGKQYYGDNDRFILHSKSLLFRIHTKSVRQGRG